MFTVWCSLALLETWCSGAEALQDRLFCCWAVMSHQQTSMKRPLLSTLSPSPLSSSSQFPSPHFTPHFSNISPPSLFFLQAQLRLAPSFFSYNGSMWFTPNEVEQYTDRHISQIRDQEAEVKTRGGGENKKRKGSDGQRNLPQVKNVTETLNSFANFPPNWS